MRKFFGMVAALAIGCSGAKATPQTPAEEPVDSGVDAAPAVDAAPPPPSGPIACRVAGGTCTEYRDAPGERAQEIKDQCTKGGGETLDACPTDKLAATCTVTKPPMTVVSSLYRTKDSKKARGFLANARRSCEANGGTFTAARR